ncbi:hypothetical protein LTR27_012920 [Elasticomyces elasticus]|nr:hypothetical protein LTR27_012920 [Elasticomyces elasticus]
MSTSPKDRAVSTSYDMPTAYSSVRLCMAWYKGNEDTAPHALEPGAMLRLSEMPRSEAFDMVYEIDEDMFAYFGNGWALEDDAETESDKMWYNGKPGCDVDLSVMDKLKGTDTSVRKRGSAR